ncbi:NfeD family protein [Vineibacter terrae]|uniref:NfeD family protein n=1 Tax=Vineibacter terrae TaxID=2586908 RepID=A0A5C8PNG4_9HYPH|nr:NfeD family protein [Vineibacter terrae]TXL76312.1 NfeD family protein [Vineibacter terrae]
MIVFWWWWAAAAVLLVCEMALPGVIFLFLAIGAVLVGVVLLLAPSTGLEIQLLIFAVTSVGAALGLRPILAQRLQTKAHATLNARAAALIGQVVTLDEPIINGRGRARVADGSWNVRGPDMVAGAEVRIVRVEGAELVVEPAR